MREECFSFEPLAFVMGSVGLTLANLKRKWGLHVVCQYVQWNGITYNQP